MNGQLAIGGYNGTSGDLAFQWCAPRKLYGNTAAQSANVQIAVQSLTDRRGPTSRERSLIRLEEQIKIFGRLPIGRDGPGASPPAEMAIDYAVQLVGTLRHHSSIALPSAAPSGDGEVILTWRHADLYVEAAFQPDGSLVWFGRRSMKDIDGDDETWKGTVPSRLLALLKLPR